MAGTRDPEAPGGSPTHGWTNVRLPIGGEGPSSGYPELRAEANPPMHIPLRRSREHATAAAGLPQPRANGPGADVASDQGMAALLAEELRQTRAELEQRVRPRTAELAASAALFGTAFEDAPTGMALVSVDSESPGRFLQVNEAFCAMTGRSAEELLELGVSDVTHPDDLDRVLALMGQLLAGALPRYRTEKRTLRADGQAVWTQVGLSLVRGDDGEPLYAIAHVEDISERKRFETRLQHLADHDALTGLFNRRRFNEELERELAYSKRFGSGGALLLLDIDNFKYVNDTLGHNAGDEVIKAVARLLRERLRETDTLARLGGDEFGVYLPSTNRPDAVALAEALTEIVRERAIVVGDQPAVRVTTSVGVVLVRAPVQVTAEELLTDADIAMYEAKEGGRDRVAVYSAASPQHAQMRARQTWSERIRGALEHDGFKLYCQPIVDLRTRATIKHELLLRMSGEGGALFPPGAFLPVAERFGLMRAIDRWVVAQAIELVASHTRDGSELHVAVNLSGQSVTDPDLPVAIEDLTHNAGIEPSCLVFEVTETAAIANIEEARAFSQRLSDLGCRFALDDFGSGFGSFYYLKYLPFDYLKIDGEFIRGLTASSTDQLVVRTLVQAARGMGKRTIAEFVGDEPTVELLCEYGVDYGQGYHIARPAPVEEVLRVAPSPV
jgi:diguanylate cyclase (GGDEF)-like protein/PAS domain S-box-containing protein